MKKIQEKVISGIIKNRLERNDLDFSPGCGCFKIKKLTEKYVIFKGCHDKTEVKFYFDFKGDMDDRIMYYLFKKNRRSHFYIKQELNIQVRKSKEKLVSEKEVLDFVNVFGHVFMSDIAEYYNTHPLKIGKIFQKLEKEGKLVDAEKEKKK